MSEIDKASRSGEDTCSSSLETEIAIARVMDIMATVPLGGEGVDIRAKLSEVDRVKKASECGSLSPATDHTNFP